MKEVKGWKSSDGKNKVLFKHFSREKAKYIRSNIIPFSNKNLGTIIIYTGTKDLKSDSSPEEISGEIINLTTSRKTQRNKVILSGIVPRYNKVNEKATRVNKRPKEECEARNIYFIDHKSISPKYYCNRSRLHLNYSGTKKSIENVYFPYVNLIDKHRW